MTIHVLVEGPSERVLFDGWAARLLKGHTVRVHPHQGKGTLPANLALGLDTNSRTLLGQLPAKLRAFATALDPKTDRVLVLVDADSDDPATLQARISNAALTLSGRVPVLVSVAVEETEAFYLGDLKGLKRAFPDADLKRAKAYEPDSIVGTWELFGAIVNDGGENKVAWAEAMAPVLTTKTSASRSPSFKTLVKGLLRLATPQPNVEPRRKPYRHQPRNNEDSTGRR